MHDPPRRGCPAPAPARPRAEAVTAGLTPEQAAAVRHGPGPLLLVAGPGTGKTRTLTHRVAYLLATGRAAPRRDPRRHLQRARRRRAAAAARRPARRADRARRDRRHLSLRLRAAAARARRRCSGAPTAYTIYDQADLRHVIERAALRPPARRDPRRRSRAAASPSAAELETPDRAGQEPAARPRTPTSGAARHPAGAAGRRRVAGVRARARALQRVVASTTCSSSRCGCCASTRSGSRTCARAGAGWSSTRCRTPTRRRPRCSHLLAGPDRQPDRGRRRRPADLPLPLRRAAQHPALRRALPRPPRRSCSARNFRSRAEILARRRRAACATTRSGTAKALIAVRGAGGQLELARASATSATRRRGSPG